MAVLAATDGPMVVEQIGEIAQIAGLRRRDAFLLGGLNFTAPYGGVPGAPYTPD